MDNHEFLHAFETAHIHPFTHADHIRMAWLYLCAHDYDTAINMIRSGIQHLATALSVSDKYHETLTVFWARAVRAAINLDITDFAAFQAQHPELFDSHYVNQFYSAELLWSDSARHAWVEPNLQPMLGRE